MPNEREQERTKPIFLRTRSGYDLDLPCVLIDALDAEAGEYRLAAQCGIAPGPPASPSILSLDGDPTWPVKDWVASGGRVDVDLPAALLAGVRCGPYEEPSRAKAIPVVASGTSLAPL